MEYQGKCLCIAVLIPRLKAKKKIHRIRIPKYSLHLMLMLTEFIEDFLKYATFYSPSILLSNARRAGYSYFKRANFRFHEHFYTGRYRYHYHGNAIDGRLLMSGILGWFFCVDKIGDRSNRIIAPMLLISKLN
jgi:hypothetical protein